MIEQNVFSGFTNTFKYFKQPYRLGEIVTINGNEHLIIGIEDVRIWHLGVDVRYTTQILNNYNFSYKQYAAAAEVSNMVELYTEQRYDADILKKFKPGFTTNVTIKNITALYKMMEYTEIEFVGTNLRICANFKLVVPHPPGETKALYFQKKREALKIEIL